MKQTLSADIADFVAKSDARLLAVVRNSVRDMVEDMQTPTGKGGRMRVDTGFLRASGRAAIGSVPSGPNQKPAGAPTGQYTGALDTYDGTALNAVLLDLQIGETFFWGWTAAYAEVREVYDGFMDTAIQNWQNYVTINSERFRGT
jgi:hypothetical protein